MFGKRFGFCAGVACGLASCGQEFKEAPSARGGSSAMDGGSSAADAGEATSNGGERMSAGGHANTAGSEAAAAGQATAGLPGDGGEPGSSAGTGAVEPGCQSINDCVAGNNCIAGACQPALVSCAAHKNTYPNARDGVYWIGAGSAVERAYCDMTLSTELCTEVAGEHQGRTRDKAKLGYRMSSVLLLNQGVCKLWALRNADDNHPFDYLRAVAGVPAAQTCISLGFVADGVLGSCSYGSTRSNCGFTAAPLYYWYGNSCAGCDLHEGDFDRWTLQGPASKGGLLSTMSGTTFTTCKTQ